MPVKGRSDMLERAVELYKAQDYQHIELIIYESGARIPSFSSTQYNISHVCTMDIPTIGMARNKAIAWASGEIVVHLDSDDYYAKDWVSTSVRMLIESKADMVGMKDAYFYKPATNQLWHYTNNCHEKPYVVLGATMCYWKKAWQDSRYPLSFDRTGQGFRNVARGEDAQFCEYAGEIAQHNYLDGFMAMRHGANSSNDKILNHPYFKKQQPEKAIQILGDNYERFTQRQSAA